MARDVGHDRTAAGGDENPGEGRPSREGRAARPRVVIVGGGFGGLAAARELRGADAEVTVVDRMSHHLFQPLLYQAAVGSLSEGQIASPIRVLLKRQRNARASMAEATDLDVDGHKLSLDTGEELEYDSLILACGAETSYSGHDEWRQVSFGLKTLADVVRLRGHIFSAFEEAERATDSATREEWLTFVVVGGGPTGVETSGVLAILAGALRRDFSRADTTKARVILVDAGERVVPAFSERLSAKAADGLASLGVTVRGGLRATAIDDRGVTVKTEQAEERIGSRTVIWAAGVGAARLTEAVARATRANTDRGGRIEVNPDWMIPGHPEISAIGDMAVIPAPTTRHCPVWRRWRSSKPATWRKGSGPASREHRRHSATSTKVRLRWSDAARPSARYGGAKSQAASPSTCIRCSSVLPQRRVGQPTGRDQGLDQRAVRCG